jgi:hypothetical protein
MNIVKWLIANWVVVTAIALAVVRLLESIEVVLKDGKAKSAIDFIIATIKEIFRLG